VVYSGIGGTPESGTGYGTRGVLKGGDPVEVRDWKASRGMAKDFDLVLDRVVDTIR
jgi:hypothetical protein